MEEDVSAAEEMITPEPIVLKEMWWQSLKINKISSDYKRIYFGFQLSICIFYSADHKSLVVAADWE